MLKIGIVDLCTSHPEAFVPILRELGCEITAVYDSAQTRDKDFVNQFAQKMDIAHVCQSIEEMVPLVDAATIHSANWDMHIKRAKPFIKAGKFVCIDKPVVGNMSDLRELLDLDKKYPNLIFGGSACVFAKETKRLAEISHRADDKVVSAMVSGPFDMFSYGIHTVELLQKIAGYNAKSVTCLQNEPLGNYLVNFSQGFSAHLHLHTPYQGWFALVEMFNSATTFSGINSDDLYPPFLKAFLDFCMGNLSKWTLANSLQPVQTALAIKKASKNPGKEISLDSITDEDMFNGAEFARKYSEARDNDKVLYLLEKDKRWGSY